MFRCSCGTKAKCTDSRHKDNRTWRRFRCPACSKRFSTLELIAVKQTGEGNKMGIKIRPKPISRDKVLELVGVVQEFIANTPRQSLDET